MTRVIALLLALLLLLVAFGCTATEATNDNSNPADTNDDTQIYATAIRQIYTVDHSFGEPPGWPIV